MKNSALKKVSAFLLTAAMISTMAVGSFTGAYAQENEKAISNNLRLNVTFDDETAQDLSGNGFDGEIVGDVEFVEGKVGKAVHIVNDESVAGEGKTAQQYIDFGEEFKFGTDDFTVMFWYKADGTDPQEVAVFSNKDWISGSNDGLVFGDMRNGMLFNIAAEGSGRYETSRHTEATDNTWHHIAATFDRDGKEIFYLDGEQIDSVDISDIAGKTIDVDGNHLVLGADGLFRYSVNDSYIDELCIYEGVVSADEIYNLNAPYILEKLERKINEYREILENSDKSQEQKDKFQQVIDEVAEKSQGVTTPEAIKEFTQQLKDAYNEFSAPEKGLASFEVISDTHIKGTDTTESMYMGLVDAIEDTKREFPDSLGIFNSGDFSEDGYENQMQGYYNIINSYKDEINFMTALGNHDVRWKSGWDEIYERYMRFNSDYMGDTDGKVYYDQWFGGYHFIVMNTEWDIKDRAYISDEQIEWLRETIAENNEDGSQPVFIMFHQAMRDTYFNSNDWDVGMQDYKIKEVLRDYPNTFMFTGHIHNGVDTCDIIQTEYGFMVDVPGFRSNDVGIARGQYGYHVTIHEDKVVISVYDYLNDCWVPEYEKVAYLSNSAASQGKVLDVTFDDETANDISGNNNNGTIVGDVKFVDGVSGKAVRITNDEEIAGTSSTAQQYIDFGDSVELGTDDFTVMFWYKAEGTDPQEVAVFGNKNWDSGSNDGLIFGDMRNGMLFNVAAGGSGTIETSRHTEATDGQWHHITATFDRDGDETFYLDGDKIDSKDISSIAGLSLDVEGNHLVLGADGCFKYGVKDSYIDELKIYKKALGASEIKTIVNPVSVNAGGTSALFTWDENDFEGDTEGAYVVVSDNAGNETRVNIDKGSSQVIVTGLETTTDYNAIFVTREKSHSGNYQDVFELSFTTTDKAGISFNLEELKAAIAEAQSVDGSNKTSQASAFLNEAIAQAKDVLAQAEMSDITETEITQTDIDEEAASLRAAVEIFKNSPAPVESETIDRTSMTATACSQYSDEVAENTDGAAESVLDGNKNTYWHTDWSSDLATPHWIQIDFEEVTEISKIGYLPRQSQLNGRWLNYDLVITDENGEEKTIISGGDLGYTSANDLTERFITFEPVKAKSVKIIITDCEGDSVGKHAAAAELNFYSPVKEEYELGDVNHDNKIDVNDVTAIQKYIVNIPLENFDQIIADVNCDGKITINDATAIQIMLNR